MDTWPEYKRMLDEERKRKNKENNRNNNNMDFVMPLMAGYMAAKAFDHNHNDYSDNNYSNDYNDNSYDNDYSDNNYDCNNDCGNSYDSSNDCMIMDSFSDFF
ncbi:MAG: DUF1190 domain-containing protein [Veillonella sp.]|jgi:hypothetical protein|nr:DUF1190 domain-containing protein [Veillonella sp.]MDU5734114.1 DUF1190 domain-containing protein [Veillonella sp.]MDU5753944.1 DUF1190 domain-containing protein [Veillonella sp.]